MTRSYHRRTFSDPQESPIVAINSDETDARPTMGRPDPRPEDPRARAAARAQQLMSDNDFNTTPDRFDAPPAPDGWAYEWKTVEVLGKEDPSYLTNLSRVGWDPVPADRHPEMMPKGWTGSVVRDGMMLMERPKVVSDAARERDQREANRLVRSVKDRMAETSAGQFERVDGNQRPTARVSTEWKTPIKVPADS